MAVKKRQQAITVRSYITDISSRAVSVTVIIGMAVFATTILMIHIIAPHSTQQLSVWLIPLSATLVAGGGSFLLFHLLFAPLRTLLRAISHATGEPIAGAIPNPHDSPYSNNGLGAAIKAVYSTLSVDTSAQAAVKSGAKTAAVTASLNRMSGGIIALDSSRTIVFASKAAPTQTVNGALRPQLLFHNNDSLDDWLDHVTSSTVRSERMWQRIPDRPADIEGQRIFDVFASYEKGAQHETIITLIDMTERYKQDEGDLNFIAFAAHELRGPITVIRGYIDVLQEELDHVLQQDQRELFHRLSVSANRLSSYVNNILNTSRYDRRHLTLTLVPDTFTHVYSTIHDDMELRATSQNRMLSVSIPSDLPQIAADRASLSEVISNLIDNAIKYSNEGGMITVTGVPHGDFVNLTVEDHGIGMNSSVMKNLFQKFYRSHRSRETVAGSGIGLYISKAIVESHGGTISVRSTEGRGSTFTISIPTYASVADKLAEDGSNQNLISHGKGWIKNHSMYRG